MTGPSLMVVPEELVRGIQQLEPLPLTARRLVELIKGKDVAFAAIADLIELDPTIVAAVLRRASTVRYAGQGTVTVREAVFRLGTVALLDLVLEGYLSKLRTSTPLYDLSEHELWLHSAAAQLAVRALAAERPKARIPAIAETAALLHDIGKLIVSRYLKADVRDLVAHARTRGITFVEAEREILGVDHTAVGAAMAEAWKFPPEIVDAIRRHHSAPFINPTVVLDAVALANVVAKTIEVGLGAEGLNFAVDPGSYQRLGVDFATFGRVCLQAESWLQDVTRAHGAAAG
jgi:putative nucleotidyltransferase with HDIG domain